MVKFAMDHLASRDAGIATLNENARAATTETLTQSRMAFELGSVEEIKAPRQNGKRFIKTEQGTFEVLEGE